MSGLKSIDKPKVKELCAPWVEYMSSPKPHPIDRDKAADFIETVYHFVLDKETPKILFAETPEEAVALIYLYDQLKEDLDIQIDNKVDGAEIDVWYRMEDGSLVKVDESGGVIGNASLLVRRDGVTRRKALDTSRYSYRDRYTGLHVAIRASRRELCKRADRIARRAAIDIDRMDSAAVGHGISLTRTSKKFRMEPLFLEDIFYDTVRVPIGMSLMRHKEYGTMRGKINRQLKPAADRIDNAWFFLKRINNGAYCRFSFLSPKQRSLSFSCDCTFRNLRWIAELDVFMKSGIWETGKTRPMAFDIYEQLRDSAGCGAYGMFFYDGLCVVCPGPETVTDGAGRYNSRIGPSIRWGDIELYFLEGVEFNQADWGGIVDETIGGGEVLKWRNQERKTIAIEYLGWGKILSDVNAIRISSHPTDHGTYEILETTFIQDDYNIFTGSYLPARFLKVICPSTLKETFLRVDPESKQCATPMGAIAWTFGMETPSYRPEEET